MVYSKAFPKRSDKSVYPQWEDSFLTESEEKEIEAKAREENKRIMSECLDDAKKILESKGSKGYESSIATIAASLFDKRARHVVYLKEEKAKEKFDK